MLVEINIVMLYFFAFVFFKVLFFVFYKSNVTGTECIPKNGAIIASNHVTYYDPFYIGQTVPRAMFFFAKRKIYDRKSLQILLKLLHTYPIEKGKKSSEAMDTASKLLKKGKIVVLFPEGTRTRGGQLGELKRGVARLALQAQVPIVPTWIGGAYDVWPRNKVFPRLFKTISCSYGKPIDPKDYSHLPNDEAIDAILSQLRIQLIELKGDRGF